MKISHRDLNSVDKDNAEYMQDLGFKPRSPKKKSNENPTILIKLFNITNRLSYTWRKEVESQDFNELMVCKLFLIFSDIQSTYLRRNAVAIIVDSAWKNDR